MIAGECAAILDQGVGDGGKTRQKQPGSLGIEEPSCQPKAACLQTLHKKEKPVSVSLNYSSFGFLPHTANSKTNRSS